MLPKAATMVAHASGWRETKAVVDDSMMLVDQTQQRSSGGCGRPNILFQAIVCRVWKTFSPRQGLLGDWQ